MYLPTAYPSTVQEIRFLTTINKGFRFPAFLVFLGSMLYWMIGRFSTKLPKYMTRKHIKALEQRIDMPMRLRAWSIQIVIFTTTMRDSYLTLYAAP